VPSSDKEGMKRLEWHFSNQIMFNKFRMVPKQEVHTDREEGLSVLGLQQGLWALQLRVLPCDDLPP
jgi:hypothetical protein